MKSLKESVISLEPTYTKSVIKSALRTEKGSGLVWVVVEDYDDTIVYERFMYKENVSLLPSLAEDGTRSCKNVESIVSDIKSEENCRLIFGIRDKDYTSYEEDSHIFPEDIFVTDCRDIEMMMLAASSVQSALSEWSTQIRQVLFGKEDIVRLFGYMRICSYRLHLGCNFRKNLKISKFWDFGSHCLYPGWRESSISVFLRNCRIPFTKSDFSNLVALLGLENESVYDICQGHDVLKFIQYTVGHTDVCDERSIRKKMVESYSLDDFSKTRLYKSIASWSADRSVSVLLPSNV